MEKGVGASDHERHAVEHPADVVPPVGWLIEKISHHHLVGHQHEGAVLIGNLRVTADSIRAMPLSDLRSVIVSSCAGGAVSTAHNVAATIAEVWGCIAWAPMVELTADAIDDVDRHLRRFIEDNPSRTVDGFMKETRSALPILRVYVRYGVCSSRRANSGP